MLMLDRRSMVRGAVLAPVALGMSGLSFASQPAAAPALPPAIGRAERLARLARARVLMNRAGLGAILVEPGASLDYFTGVRWSRSERLTAALIPASGLNSMFRSPYAFAIPTGPDAPAM